MRKTYETELPDSYRESFTVDATDKKLGLMLNGVAGAVMILVVAAAFFAIRPTLEDFTFSSNLFFLAAICFYIVAHELVHGAAYKLMTRRKLTFGMTLTVAYCGVPDIYVYRPTAMTALLAPFAVFIPVFAVPMCLFSNSVDQMLCALMLGLHLGGCAGDLWDTWLYLTRFRDNSVLMRDTGPVQTFYTAQQ